MMTDKEKKDMLDFFNMSEEYFNSHDKKEKDSLRSMYGFLKDSRKFVELAKELSKKDLSKAEKKQLKEQIKDVQDMLKNFKSNLETKNND